MSILLSTITDDRATQARRACLLQTQQFYRDLKAVQKRGLDEVWNSPLGLTPQEVFDALGTDAVKLVDFHALITDTLIEAQQRDGIPTDIAVPTSAFQRNADGTVTAFPDQPYVPSV